MLLRITADNFEHSTLVTHPKREFSSSSSGVTGSVSVYSRYSDVERSLDGNFVEFIPDVFNEDSIRPYSLASRLTGSQTAQSPAEAYMARAHRLPVLTQRQYALEINRKVPPTDFASGTLMKAAIQNTLFPYYRADYSSMHWNYTNYHTLNFFTASTVPSDSVFLYPNIAPTTSPNGSQYISGSYVVSSSFTFEFFINPRYTSDAPPASFKAGTILHLSSSYAISLITGSSRDADGYPNAFRLVLQLSHSADVDPSMIDLSSANGARAVPQNLTFVTADNVLWRNRWHHVAIRWSSDVNQGSGSFVIDGVEHTGSYFAIPLSIRSIAPAPFNSNTGPQNPNVLCLGNYYQGSNSAASVQSRFFNTISARRLGTTTLVPENENSDPTSYTFSHPLNAELHEIRIFDRYRSIEEITETMSTGISGRPSFRDTGLLFYVPPLFVRNGPRMRRVSGNSGYLRTPFYAGDDQPKAPFNVEMSFRLGGHLLNLENFAYDFVQGQFPRALNLSPIVMAVTSSQIPADVHLNSQAVIRKRNLSVLPCDNGLFTPNYSLLLTLTGSDLNPRPGESSVLGSAVDDLGYLDLSAISLRNLIPSTIKTYIDTIANVQMHDGISGPTPEYPYYDINGNNWAVYRRTRDDTSNQIVIFNISNLFYGKKIVPKSFVVVDEALTGSSSKIKMTLRDNGFGGLYRADALTEHATWNNVGNILYNEGIVVIKSPNIPHFGRDQFNVNLTGEQNIYTMKFVLPAGSGLINSSSNPTYNDVSASFNANEIDGQFVYITNINFHDENLNVIMKTHLAQPVLKRNEEKLVFKPRIDF